MRKGKTYYEGGRQFRDVLRVVNKYRMVPEEAYRLGKSKCTIPERKARVK